MTGEAWALRGAAAPGPRPAVRDKRSKNKDTRDIQPVSATVNHRGRPLGSTGRHRRHERGPECRGRGCHRCPSENRSNAGERGGRNTHALQSRKGFWRKLILDVLSFLFFFFFFDAGPLGRVGCTLGLSGSSSRSDPKLGWDASASVCLSHLSACSSVAPIRITPDL